ncbi:MAG TPA: MFS transporter [Candidatus Limnocylindria bacterium]|nr:MFS transporter [Candidatus Limnocylindria bacterium]
MTVQPSRGRALAILALAMVLSMTTWFSASAVLPTLRSIWQLSAGEGALLTIAVQLGFVAGAVTSALTNVSDLMPARRLFFLASLGAAAANGLVAVSDGLALALPLRFLTGFFVAGIYPPAMKVMATHFRTGRGQALGIMIGALTIGSALPHLVNGLGGIDWRAVVLTTSALTVVGGIVAIAFVPDGPYPFARGSFQPRFMFRMFRDPAVRLANLGYFGHMWELYAMWSWFAIFFGDSVLASGGAEGAGPLGAFVVIGAGAIGCYAGGVLGDRWGRTRTTALAMAASGTCAAVIGLTYGRSPLLVLAVGVVWGIAVIADSAQFSTMVTELADQSYVGTALTTQMAIGFSLTVATIWLVPLARDAVGWQWAFTLLVPGPLLGVWAMLSLRRRPESARIAGGRG